MIILMNLHRIGINASLLVSLHGVLFPTALEQVVENLHELVGHGISLIVLDQLLEAVRLGSTFQVSSNDVPYGRSAIFLLCL